MLCVADEWFHLEETAFFKFISERNNLDYINMSEYPESFWNKLANAHEWKLLSSAFYILETLAKVVVNEMTSEMTRMQNPSTNSLTSWQPVGIRDKIKQRGEGEILLRMSDFMATQWGQNTTLQS